MFVYPLSLFSRSEKTFIGWQELINTTEHSLVLVYKLCKSYCIIVKCDLTFSYIKMLYN